MKHLFYLLLMIPIVGYTQNIIPDDSTDVNLTYVSNWYNSNNKLLVYQYELVKQDDGLYQKELVAHKCKVKKIITIRGGYFKLMVVKVNNRNYNIGYYNYLAAINRFNITDVFYDLKHKKLNLILNNNELSLMYK